MTAVRVDVAPVRRFYPGKARCVRPKSVSVCEQEAQVCRSKQTSLLISKRVGASQSGRLRHMRQPQVHESREAMQSLPFSTNNLT